MTEIPEHLLQRTRDRRKALGLDTGEGDTSTPDVAAAVSESTPAVAGAAAGAAPAAKVPVPLPAMDAPPPTPPTPPWVAAAEGRKRIPTWVMPFLLFLPIWAFMYVGTLEDPTREEGLIYEGGVVYAENCAVCHGSGGGGGSGPAFTNGVLIETFSSFEEQIEWVTKGTQGYIDENRDTYGDTAKAVGGGGVMPGFSEDLTAAEITLAILYERIELSGWEAELALGEVIFDKIDHSEFEELLEELAGELETENLEDGHFGENISVATLNEVFANMRAEANGEEVAAG